MSAAKHVLECHVAEHNTYIRWKADELQRAETNAARLKDELAEMLSGRNEIQLYINANFYQSRVWQAFSEVPAGVRVVDIDGDEWTGDRLGDEDWITEFAPFTEVL